MLLAGMLASSMIPNRSDIVMLRKPKLTPKPEDAVAEKLALLVRQELVVEAVYRFLED